MKKKLSEIVEKHKQNNENIFFLFKNKKNELYLKCILDIDVEESDLKKFAETFLLNKIFLYKNENLLFFCSIFLKLFEKSKKKKYLNYVKKIIDFILDKKLVLKNNFYFLKNKNIFSPHFSNGTIGFFYFGQI